MRLTPSVTEPAARPKIAPRAAEMADFADFGLGVIPVSHVGHERHHATFSGGNTTLKQSARHEQRVGSVEVEPEGEHGVDPRWLLELRGLPGEAVVLRCDRRARRPSSTRPSVSRPRRSGTPVRRPPARRTGGEPTARAPWRGPLGTSPDRRRTVRRTEQDASQPCRCNSHGQEKDRRLAIPLHVRPYVHLRERRHPSAVEPYVLVAVRDQRDDPHSRRRSRAAARLRAAGARRAGRPPRRRAESPRGQRQQHPRLSPPDAEAEAAVQAERPEVDTRAAIDRFLASFGLAEATRRSYASDLAEFSSWLAAGRRGSDAADEGSPRMRPSSARAGRAGNRASWRSRRSHGSSQPSDRSSGRRAVRPSCPTSSSAGGRGEGFRTLRHRARPMHSCAASTARIRSRFATARSSS